jgi:hypothetical protein
MDDFAQRLTARMRAVRIRNADTGAVMPLTVSRLYRLAASRFDPPPFSERTLYRWCAGSSVASGEQVEKLATLLGVEPAYFRVSEQSR